MKFQKHRFNPQKDAEFAQVLRKRVFEYFKSNNIPQHANAGMVFKTVFMLTLALLPLVLMLTGIVTGMGWYVLCWALMGLGMAGVGLSVMHDSVHGSYSTNPTVNNLVGQTMNIIGGNRYIWKIQHNVLHHSFTNVAHADDDIETPSFLRISPHRERTKIHRFQFIYAWFLYALSSVFWVTAKDFRRIYLYRDMGLTGDQKEFRREFAKIALWKAFYYAYILVVPMMILPIPWYSTLALFGIMHLVLGTTLSCVFQAAHILPELDFVENTEDQINQNWFVHQLRTTSNFSQKNKLLSWFIGGLNFQVEHHLFPNICHVHYPKISKIVRATAEEYEIPYHDAGSFLTAMRKHLQMLILLGKTDDIQTVTHSMEAAVEKKPEPVLA